MHPDLLLHGKRAHAACALTTTFIRNYGPQIETATAVADDCTEADGVRPQTIRGYYARTVAWMQSIGKLADPGDVQAVAVAARALFEGQVDLVLLHHAPQDHPAQKVFDWERSALLKHAEKVQRFFQGKALPLGYQGFPIFLTGNEVPRIRAARDRWWNGTHPGRWTGKNLELDAKRANELFPEARLAEFYELEYSPACWGAHGSGLPGLRSRNPGLVVATYIGLLWTLQRFALLNARSVLADLGLFLKVVFDDFEREAEHRIQTIQLEASQIAGL